MIRPAKVFFRMDGADPEFTVNGLSLLSGTTGIQITANAKEPFPRVDVSLLGAVEFSGDADVHVHVQGPTPADWLRRVDKKRLLGLVDDGGYSEHPAITALQVLLLMAEEASDAGNGETGR